MSIVNMDHLGSSVIVIVLGLQKDACDVIHHDLLSQFSLLAYFSFEKQLWSYNCALIMTVLLLPHLL